MGTLVRILIVVVVVFGSLWWIWLERKTISRALMETFVSWLVIFAAFSVASWFAGIAQQNDVIALQIHREGEGYFRGKAEEARAEYLLILHKSYPLQNGSEVDFLNAKMTGAAFARSEEALRKAEEHQIIANELLFRIRSRVENWWYLFMMNEDGEVVWTWYEDLRRLIFDPEND